MKAITSGINLRQIVVAAAVIAAFATGPADARRHHRAAQQASTNLPVDSTGTPIIMKGYQADRGYHGDKVRVIPQVNGPITVPPVLPHNGLRDLPPRQLLQAPAPPVYTQAPQTSFSDKVTNCIHSFPLNAGVGNNPTSQGAYIGQCANQ